MSTALKRAGKWKPLFLAEFTKHGNVSAAAKAAGVDRTTVNRHRDHDAAFDEACLVALDEAADQVEAAIVKRAIVGESRTKVETFRDASGAVVSTKTTTETGKSDLLLIFQAKALRPEKYRDNYDLKTLVATLANAQGSAGVGPVGVAKAPGRKRSS